MSAVDERLVELLGLGVGVTAGVVHLDRAAVADLRDSLLEPVDVQRLLDLRPDSSAARTAITVESTAAQPESTLVDEQAADQ